MLYSPKDENGHEMQVADFVKIQARELEAWQRWLWQHVFQDDYAKILEIERLYWERLENAETRAQALKRLPAQIVVFSLLELPPSQLDFYAVWGNTLISIFFTSTPRRNIGRTVSIPTGKPDLICSGKSALFSVLKTRQRKPNDAEIKDFRIKQLNFNAEDRESRHPLLTRFGKQARDHFSTL